MPSVLNSVSPAQRHLIEYYRAFELLLSPQRTRNELRTHFGYMPDDEVTKDYCFFKAISAPDRFPAMTTSCSRSSDALHHRLFGPTNPVSGRVLDVGFGSGGTLQRLLLDWPDAQLEGINLNPLQHGIATRQLGHLPHLTLHLGDFLTYDFPVPYQLMYFIESAFHMADKTRLVKQIADNLVAGGVAYVVDIFYSDTLRRFMGTKKKVNEAIFDYIGIDDWARLGEAEGLRVTEFDDFSNEAANHITVRTSPAEFESELLHPLVSHLTEERELMESRIWEAYHGYVRLHKLFKKGLLRYGILRFEKG
ncbi:MAG TPA: hypothetical protein DCE41_02380 [Cytophagales bacterium]|nr:hypothetical protein [Cytophagales bacterium]HAA23939.1 hypothetical protein [Cytophagales bacterium]HAP59393.1 hypothetical protein [Cytophagales bacterium]